MPSASSPLTHVGFVELPKHEASGGFDHAAVHAASGHVYLAHTANHAVDVFDPSSQKHLFSIPELSGVAGVLVSDEAELVITSNRADTLTVVAADERVVRAEIPVSGRDPEAGAFYVNIADPAEIVVVDARRPNRIARTFAVPSGGPHGLDFDLSTHRLFCACDAGELITLDTASGKILGRNPLSGPPDVVFFDRVRGRLYVAVGDPGVIDVLDTRTMKKLGSVATEEGAHTFALAPNGDRVYAFLPRSHRAAIYEATRN